MSAQLPSSVVNYIYTMLPLTTTTLLFSALALVNGLAIDTGSKPQHEDNRHGKKRPCPTTTCLAANALQTASYYTGLEEGTAGIRPGLSKLSTCVPHAQVLAMN